MDNTNSVCEEQVYNNLYKTHAKSLRNHLYFKFGDLEKAEDVVQEAFVKLWMKCSTVLFDNVGGFLYTISKNLFIDKIRSKKVSLEFEKNYITVEHESEDPYFHLRTKEFKQQIEKSIAALPEKQREAFLLNRIEKLTYKEIAQKLEISQTAVENRISKALIKLKEIVEVQKFNI